MRKMVRKKQRPGLEEVERGDEGMGGVVGGVESDEVGMQFQYRRASDNWNFNPFGFDSNTHFPPMPRRRHNSSDDIFKTQVSKDVNRNETGKQHTADKASCGARRLSGLPRPVSRSPVQTRLRSVNRPSASDDTQPKINTALQGMHNNTNNAGRVRGGGGVGTRGGNRNNQK